MSHVQYFFLLLTDHLAILCAESAAEEPGDEGADGPDEEPAVGRQRHADPQEMMTCVTIPKLRQLPVCVFERGTPSSRCAGCPSPKVTSLGENSVTLAVLLTSMSSVGRARRSNLH